MIALLNEKKKEFLGYLLNIRGYPETTIITYEVALRQMSEVSHFFLEEERYTLDITPFRFKIVKNSKKTIMKKLSAVRSFVKYMEEQCLMEIKLIGNETIKVPKSLPKPIEEKYIQEVLEEASLEQKVIIMILYGLGLRISELSHLKLVDIQEEWIQILGKGNRVRELPLLKELQVLIKRYISQYHPTVYLFETKETKMNTAQLRYIISKLFRKLGLKVTPHQLRHSFATHLLNNGARISDISELLGHKTMATTQVYTKLGSMKKMQEYMNAHPLANLK